MSLPQLPHRASETGHDKLLAKPNRQTHSSFATESGEDRSRQPMIGAAVHDPKRRFAERARCNAARTACSDPDL